MDFGTIIGILLGILCVFLSIKSDMGAFYDLNSIFVTIGGTIASTFISFRLKEMIKIFKITFLIFTAKKESLTDTIQLITRLAAKARQEGLLALENEKESIPDPFIRNSLDYVIDGYDPSVIKDSVEMELENLRTRHEQGKALFDFMGKMFPAWGMIGTLMGLVLLLKQLDDPSKIGPAMGLALITTFYGSMMANFVCIPISNKLSLKSDEEIFRKTMILEGILSIQTGENPRMIEQKLKTFLSPDQKREYEKQAEAKTAQGRADDPALEG